MPEAPSISPILKPGFPGVVKVSRTPVDGVHEVETTQQVFFCSDSGYIFTGKLLSPNGEVLGGGKCVNSFKNIDISIALKIGNGGREIIEFANLNCPYSRELNTYLSAKPDLTRYVFLKHNKNVPLNETVTAAVMEYPDLLDQGYSINHDSMILYRPTRFAREKLERHQDIFRMFGIAATPIVVVDGEVLTGLDTIKSYFAHKEL